MSPGLTRWLKGLFGRNGPTGPVPLTYDPEFSCWRCRAALPRPGVTCPACGEAPPKH